MIGAGKYDELCTIVREEAEAGAAIVIIVQGNKGSGFSCQADVEIVRRLPDMLEMIADQIRNDCDKQSQH